MNTFCLKKSVFKKVSNFGGMYFMCARKHPNTNKLIMNPRNIFVNDFYFV